MKYLLWALVIYLAWRWYTASKAPAKSAGKEDAAMPPGADGTTEAMVKCAQCGIYLPQSEAVRGSDAVSFCSEDHRAIHSHR